MNVVGRVSNLISQGVYSVATPFHPFGGAVDIIVVEQEDGSYRSTPWYVRFGKFQGVLKGAEKIVRISVNGTETDFHMYLDNSGEAYFVRKVDSDGVDSYSGYHINDFNASSLDQPESKADGSLNGNDKSTYENGVEKQEHAKNGSNTFGMQDEDQSLETPSDSPHFSADSQEFPSYHYGSLDEVEDVVESSKNSNSEMVLISVDGHVLTAPISSSEEVTENLELNTPQFHLGPGESSSEDFGSERGGWAATLFEDMEPSSSDVRGTCKIKLGDSDNKKDNTADEQESHCVEQMDLTNKPDDHSRGLYRKDTFMSCCEFPEISDDIDDLDLQTQRLPQILNPEGQSDIHLEVSPCLTSENYDHKEEAGNHSGGASVILLSSETTSSKVKVHEEGLLVKNVTEHVNAGCASVSAVSDARELHTSERCMTSLTDDVSPAAKSDTGYQDKGSIEVENLTNVDSASLSFESPKSNVEQEDELAGGAGPFSRYAGQESDKVENSETKGSTNSVNMGFELSLCATLLHSGMGSSFALEVFETHRISKEDFELSAASIIKNENLIVRFKGKYFNWDKVAPVVLGMAVYGEDISIKLKDFIPVEKQESHKREDPPSVSPSRGWRLWPIPFRRVKSFRSPTINSSNGASDSESSPRILQKELSLSCNGADVESSRKQYMRTNVPTTEQISSLNLKDGQNMVAFSFSTRLWGKQQVDAHIYLWKWNARIVISDVDGTITKSDVLGQFMPLVGRDWSQSGVAGLFSAIKENGYQLLFLSARAIVQAYLTRSFLLNLKQDGKTLPTGPIVISPDGLLPSLYREVIRRAPHEFKIACLEDIRALFPSDYNPFYAGFGNRDTDELSYRKIGIPKGKIFIINPKGEVAINHRVDVKSYTSLHTLVNDMFPPTSLAEQVL